MNNMILCSHCREAIASRGEKFAGGPLSSESLQKAKEEDGELWLTCEWCREDSPVSDLEEVVFKDD